MRFNRAKKVAFVIVALALAPVLAQAQICDVPSFLFATVQSAIDNISCTTINLANQTYPESVLIARSLTVAGPDPTTPATIAGHMQVEGSATVVDMSNVLVQNGCVPEAMLVTAGGQVNSSKLDVVWVDGNPCPTG